MATVPEPILPTDDSPRLRRHPLVWLLAAVSAGIAVDRCAAIGWLTAWSLVPLALVAWLVLWRFRWHAAAMLPLLGGAVLLGAAWHHQAWHLYDRDEIGRFASLDASPVCLEATALTNVRWRPAPARDPLRIIPEGDTCRVVVRVERLRDGERWRRATGRATLTVDGHLLGVRAGDRVRIFGLVQRIGAPLNPKEFDRAVHARAERELVRLLVPSPDCITLVERGSLFSPRRQLHALRDRLNAQLWQQLSPQRAGLAAGLLVGSREQIEYEQTQQFFLTGTIHLLAISGMHVSILALGFWLIVRTGIIGRKTSIVAAIVLVSLYALIADLQPPVLRSAILIGVVCIGRWLGRPTSPLNALAAGGLVVLAINPCQLFQIGAQLSFLAVATLILCAPMLIARREPDPLKRLILESRPWPIRAAWWFVSFCFRLWLTGAAVWIVALPLTLYRFHLVSPAALWLNSILYIPILVAMYAGFGALTLGWLLPPLGGICSWFCDGALAGVEILIAAGERTPLSHVWLPAPPLWWVVVFYAALALLAIEPRLRPPRRWLFVLASLWAAVGCCAVERSPLRSWFENEPPQLACTFVAVGHGTSVLVEFADGRTLLYDAGHMGTPTSGASTISAVLWSRGITHLDAVVLSHADADHYNALPELLRRFSVGVVYVSPVMFHREPESVLALRKAIEEHGIPLKTIDSRQTLRLSGDARCRVLHPPRRGVPGSDNANSIVLALEYAGRRILLPGDLETPGLEDVLEEEPLPTDVVMAPHHGSARSNPRGFAAWATPAWVVISGGRSRDAGPVVDAYRSAGAEVLHTAHDGAVRVCIRENELTVDCWQDYAWRRKFHRAERAK